LLKSLRWFFYSKRDRDIVCIILSGLTGKKVNVTLNNMDTAQIALFIVIIILTILLLALGVQVFFILREFRKTVFKANKILDNTNVITESVSAPISSLSSIATGIKAGASFVNLFKKIISSDKNEKKKSKGHKNE
jgi:hypothetical protein